MKQDITIFQVDSFIDFSGAEHKIVACALSQSPEDEDYSLKVGWADDEDVLDQDDELYHDIYRMVTVAIAVCNPTDDFDVEVGKKIAESKARNTENLPRLYATDRGVITREIVDAFLTQQVRFFKEDPETLIPGYNKAKKDYELARAAEAEIKNLTEDERTAFDLAVKGVNLSKCVDLAKVYLKKLLHE